MVLTYTILILDDYEAFTKCSTLWLRTELFSLFSGRIDRVLSVIFVFFMSTKCCISNLKFHEGQIDALLG